MIQNCADSGMAALLACTIFKQTPPGLAEDHHLPVGRWLPARQQVIRFAVRQMILPKWSGCSYSFLRTPLKIGFPDIFHPFRFPNRPLHPNRYPGQDQYCFPVRILTTLPIHGFLQKARKAYCSHQHPALHPVRIKRLSFRYRFLSRIPAGKIHLVCL